MEKKQVYKKYFWEKLHHTDCVARMSSVKLEVGELTGMWVFFQKLLHHTEYDGGMSSASFESGKRTGL